MPDSWITLSRLEKTELLKALKREEAEHERSKWADFTSAWYCDRLECDGNPHEGWHWCAHPLSAPSKVHEPACRHARTEQRPPTNDDWLVWMFLAGRGAGKTRGFAEWVIHMVRKGFAERVALVGRVPSDVRDVMVEGESGILACSPKDFMPDYKPSIRRLTWPNGAVGITYSSENPSELRGPQHDLAWCDELAAWRDAKRGDVVDTTWNNLMLGLRLGSNPRCGVSTTPRSLRLVKEILESRSTTPTSASTYDNMANLAPTFREKILSTYEGTRIGRQEVMGELLTDVDGALVTVAMIDDSRFKDDPDDGYMRKVVGIDPATTSGEDSDETGIVVCAKGRDRQGYVLGDYSMKGTPHEWGTMAVRAYREHQCDCVVVEKNQGGEAWEAIIHSIDPTIRVVLVHVRQGKEVRAEPCAALFEQDRMHMVGTWAKLEDQWTQWVPGEDLGYSPDRLDAMVHGMKELGLLEFGAGASFIEHWSRNSTRSASQQQGPNLKLLPSLNDREPVPCRKHFFGIPDAETGERRCVHCGELPEAKSG